MARRSTIVAAVVVVVVLGLAAAWWLRAADEARPRPVAKMDDSTTTRPAGDARARALFGEVTSASGTPLGGARITIVHRGITSSVVAAPDGEFTIDPLPDDLERVEFSARGYVTVVVDADQLPHQVEAFWAQQLTLDTSIPGLLVFGAPSPGAAPIHVAGASLVRVDEVDGKRPRFSTTGTSDDDGRLPRPEADGHRYVVVHPAWGAVVVADPVHAEQVTLPTPAQIAGRVVDDRRRPVPTAILHVRNASVSDSGDEALLAGALRLVSRQRDDIVIDADGHFDLQVPARDIVIEATAVGYRPQLDLEVRPRADAVLPLEIRLEASPTLAGVVVDDTGRPIAGAIVGIDTSRADTRVRTDVDGRFTIAELAARPSSLTVEAEGYRTITVGGIDGAASRVDDLRIEMQSGKGRAVVGIGVTVGKNTAGPGVLIRTVEPNTPAERAGLVANEVIVAADGVTLDDDLAASMGRVRGAPGTSVTLQIEGEGGRRRFVTVERAQISVNGAVRTR